MDSRSSSIDTHLQDLWRAADRIDISLENPRYPDALLLSLADERRLHHHHFEAWVTETKTVEASVGKILWSSAGSAGVTTALVEIGDALGRLRLERGQLLVALAAPDAEETGEAMRRLRERFPEPNLPPDEPRVSIEFAWEGPQGAAGRRSRTLDVVRWQDVRGNYAASTQVRLDTLAKDFEPGRSGQTIVWHGAPGTGKTNAVRALAFEWREWCDFSVVTDPDRLFGESATYLMDLIDDWSLMDSDGDRWRAIVLEDAGELLTGDARRFVGQGLSRYLNMCDGLLGQVQKLLLIVTTNEPLRRLHPAVTRPGRCAAEVEFRLLEADEANAWLEERSEARVSKPIALADLYALVSDTPPVVSQEPWVGIGFGSAMTSRHQAGEREIPQIT